MFSGDFGVNKFVAIEGRINAFYDNFRLRELLCADESQIKRGFAHVPNSFSLHRDVVDRDVLIQDVLLKMSIYIRP